MNLISIAWKSLKQRRLASCLTAFSIALGVMLMVLVLVIFGAVDSAFTQRSIAYDLIVGPKGSDLQLVLSAVYRMQPPIENLPYLYLEQLKKDRRVVSAVPLAFGDVTQEGSFPIIGTTPEYFENDYMPGRAFKIRLSDSRSLGKTNGILVRRLPSFTAVRTVGMCMMKSSSLSPCWLRQAQRMTGPCF